MWSACPWVYSTASRRLMPSRSACSRKSGPLSMTMRCPSHSIITEGRVRRSRGSLEWQTAQSHPIVGTPIEVPLPSTVTVPFFTCGRLLARREPSASPGGRSCSRFPCRSSEAGTSCWSGSPASCSVRLPLVFSSSTAIRSIICRSPTMSTRRSVPLSIAPAYIIAVCTSMSSR